MPPYLLAIDQGTTSTRAILFRPDLTILASASQEFAQHFPTSGWVEHDPEDLWRSVLHTGRAAIQGAGILPSEIAAIGITNQRETSLIWERDTGIPIHRAIVWQDRRTADACEALRQAGHEAEVTATTGLLLDPYFSGTKAAWLLEHVAGARARAERGELAFGTVDSFLISRLTKGAVHATDATNASRTLLFDITRAEWSEPMLRLFDVPASLLPVVKDCAADFGVADKEWFGAPIPILGVAGDQQAATIGQACFQPGMMKATYGTGCFALLNVGARPCFSRNRLLATIAYQFAGKRAYALEGSIFVAGAAVQWLRDGLKLISHAAESGTLAAQADPAQQVYLVPAFVGLGAPHWDADARGALFGLTRATGAAELAKAALDSVCYQTRDLIEAMQADWPGAGEATPVLRVDGGMTASNWTMQRLADLLGAPVDRPHVLETTALGAAYLAGYQAGLCPAPETFAKTWAVERRFEPHLASAARDEAHSGWKDALRRTLSRA